MSGTHLSSGGSAQPASAEMHDEIAQLREAVQSQRDIGMAIGLLSARFGCSTEQAWRTMLRVSQDSNTKVRRVARVLVSTHDGAADDEERELLRTLMAHLPATGWPEGSGTGEDPGP